MIYRISRVFTILRVSNRVDEPVSNGEESGSYFGPFLCLQALERISRKNNNTIMLANFVPNIKFCALYTN